MSTERLHNTPRIPVSNRYIGFKSYHKVIPRCRIGTGGLGNGEAGEVGGSSSGQGS